MLKTGKPDYEKGFLPNKKSKGLSRPKFLSNSGTMIAGTILASSFEEQGGQNIGHLQLTRLDRSIASEGHPPSYIRAAIFEQ